jgi:P-type Cu+ transporter
MTNQEPQPTQTVDPVCGMTVDIDRATGAGLTVEHDGRHYYFCGRGCKLDFEDDPGRFLNPTHQPSM